MGDVSRHFSRHEFACKDGCGFQAVDKELLDVLEDARTHFGTAVTINCACRCPAHNKAVGGAEHSQHLYGMAADIRVSGYSPAVVADYFESQYPKKYGVGRYSSFTHIDVRPNGPARWNG